LDRNSIAGGETVATFLAAVTYYLLSTPEAYKKLRDEIRGKYMDISEINSTSALQLPYLQAVISEGLRIYPPGSQGFPRVTPPTEGIWVDKRYVPGNVINSYSVTLGEGDTTDSHFPRPRFIHLRGHSRMTPVTSISLLNSNLSAGWTLSALIIKRLVSPFRWDQEAASDGSMYFS
jgi:hypothetical protein